MYLRTADDATQALEPISLFNQPTWYPSLQGISGQRVRIPLWIIAHRKNNLSDVRTALAEGANALECDLRWDGRRFVVQHDRSERPFDFIQWLLGVRGLRTQYPNLSLVIFDYKEPENERVKLIMGQIREHLTSSQDRMPLDILISLGDWNSRQILEPLFKNLAPHEGVAIDQDVTPQQSSQYFDDRFRELGVRNRNQAYGNGRLVIGREGNRRKQIMDAVALKSLEEKIKFVYVWTLGQRDSVAEYLNIGVDAVFVNNPQIALDVVNRTPFLDRYRLAGRTDRVFQPPSIPAYVLTVRTGDRRHAGTDANLTFRLVGEGGHEASTRINTFKPGLFERGSIDLVTLRGMEIGRPVRLIVSRNRSGNAPGWFLETIEVRRPGDTGRYTFRFNHLI